MSDDLEQRALVARLAEAMASMMTPDGPLPGSVLQRMLVPEPGDDDESTALLMLRFTTELLGVDAAVADEIVGEWAATLDFSDLEPE